MLKKLSVIFVCLLLAGCAHVSITESIFDGETNGFNPYGNGDAKISRVSAWGTSETLVLEAMEIYRSLVVVEDRDTELSSGKEEIIE